MCFNGFAFDWSAPLENLGSGACNGLDEGGRVDTEFAPTEPVKSTSHFSYPFLLYVTPGA